MHWEEQEVASTPDEYGTMYSGCAMVDEKKIQPVTEKDALLVFLYSGRRDERVVEGSRQSLHTEADVVPTDGDENHS